MGSFDDVRHLLHAYSERLDAGDLDGVAALFARATLRSSVGNEERQGSDVIRHLYDAVLLYDGSPRTKHVIANVFIAEDGTENGRQTFKSRCSFAVFHSSPGFGLAPILAGRYHDRFAAFDDGLWYTQRLILPDLRGDLRGHWAPAR
jgi:3-phenylpropionate/cinnamic acid dioxygenase small subunit